MAQFKLHGQTAYIIHNFNNLPDLIVMKFGGLKNGMSYNQWRRHILRVNNINQEE